MQLTQVIFRSLSWISLESAALRQWIPVIYNRINWNASWFHWPRTSHKLQFSQLPNQHGTTWAVTSTAQWADCFWECTTHSPKLGGLYWFFPPKKFEATSSPQAGVQFLMSNECRVLMLRIWDTLSEAIGSLGCRCNSSSGSVLIRQLTEVQLLTSFKTTRLGVFSVRSTGCHLIQLH